MSRLSEKLRLHLLLVRPTKFLSQELARLSLSTLHLCKSLARALASKTLAFFTMDDLSSSSAIDDDLWDIDSRYRFRPQRRLLGDDYDDGADNSIDKVYLVPYRWWKESQRDDDDETGGVLYSVSVNDDTDSEIVLDLKKVDSGKSNKAKEGFSAREYALLPEALWLRALKRHYDLSAAEKDMGSFYGAGDSLQDVFPIQIRLFVLWETNSLVVKVIQEDNVHNSYKKACNIFSSEPEPLSIWDFSGQTTQFFFNDRINMSKDSPAQLGKEILLELQVYGFSDAPRGRNEMAIQSKVEDPFCSGPFKMNGSTERVNLTNSSRSGGSYQGAGSLGLTGLQNLGNTCFMNSSIQCLVHTTKLVDYFLGDYQKEINYDNPLGMKGELALAFGDLLRRLWAPGVRPVAPRLFKTKLADFAPQFSGYNQHDSQEFLAFLLDGLHEDLNRVKCKPYIEAKDVEGRPDEEVAEEYWKNHLARNDSIVVDACQVVINAIKSILSWLEPSGAIALIRDEDKLVAYRLPKYSEKSPLVVFKHQQVENYGIIPKWKTFGIPLVARLSDISDGSDIRKGFLKILSPFLMPNEDTLYTYDEGTGNSGKEDSEMEDATSPTVLDAAAGSDSGRLDETHLDTDFQFYRGPEFSEIKMNEPVMVSGSIKELEVLVSWSDKMIEKYDTCLLSSLPEVFKPQRSINRTQDSVSLYKCLEAFLKEEPLGPEDMWYCPSCKNPRQAIKKLDLWRLPEILVIHLKRFSYGRYFKNKLETFVDFPVDDLDFSTFIAHKSSQLSNRYILYAISNHYGGLGGGHYTASVHHGNGMWVEFDDDKVFPITKDRIKTSAAYVLFYRRAPNV
ncbi:hypothetical protein I3843_09G022800 [Carya illinoinensis]|nr:hypothetical protein I3843_09G022800 [Carya illinoinensis]